LHTRPLHLTLELLRQRIDLGEQFDIDRDLFLDFFYCTDHRGVITTIEDSCDHGVRIIVQQVANQVHRNVASLNQWSQPLGAQDVFGAQTIKIGYGLHNCLGFEHNMLVSEAGEVFLRQFERDGNLVQVGECPQHRDGALELSNVVADAVGNPFGDVVGQGNPLGLGLRAQDGDSRLEVGLINMSDESLE
jgi:hypothetical protein